jgi:DNA invertase Pin-like site-specific DNA recombinase
MTKVPPRLAFSYLRMSTADQLEGDSKRRQLERSIAYARVNGLELADASQFLEDIGVSAFKGNNVRDGALGRFLEAAEQKIIPEGSYLLVESLDRITRQEIRKSLMLFVRILDAGINIVTLQDNHVYFAKPDKSEEHSSIMSLLTMSRAHEESEIKSQRVGAAWANKRAQASSHPLTKWCPAWLRMREDRSGYEQIKDRVVIVRSIFEEATAGVGILTIAKRFNQKQVPLMGKSNGWHPSYIAKILNSRAVLGEYQPCKSIRGKRTPVGEPIKDYFPAIVGEDLFYRAQQCKADRRANGQGRKGTYFTNLFSGLATCAYCGSRITVQNKGRLPKGGRFLVCSGAKRGLGCVSNGWRYEHFETSFLAFVDKVDLPNVIELADGERKSLEEELQSLDGQKLVIKKDMETTYKLLQHADIAFVAEKLKSLQQRYDTTEQRQKQIKLELESRESTRQAYYEGKEEIKFLIARLQDQAAKANDL